DLGNADAAGGLIDLRGRIQAQAVQVLTGTGADSVHVALQALAGNTRIETGAGTDTILIDSLPGMNSVNGVAVPAGPNGKPVFARDPQGREIRDEVTIDGGAGTDHVAIQIAGGADYVINVHDSGAADDGVDVLTIDGLASDD